MRALLAILLACALPCAARAADLAPEAVQSFLADHARQPGVMVRPSGLQVRILRNGNGRRIAPRDSIQIYFTARLADGRVIDGTSPGLPAPIDLSGTLPGLGEGLQQMREGDRWELILPPALAFGARGGGGGSIAPGQPLLFDVTVVAATPGAMGGVGPSNGFSFAAGNGESHAYFTIHP